MQLTEGQKNILKRVTGKEEVTIDDYYTVVESLVEDVHKHQKEIYGSDGVEEGKKIISKIEDMVLQGVDHFKEANQSKIDPSKVGQKYIYKNWKGETNIRNIVPIDITYGVNEYHVHPTYLLKAWDLDKKDFRTFDMKELLPYIEISEKQEYILCSAIHFDDKQIHAHQPKNILSGFVLCGRRHHNIFAQFVALGIDRSKVIAMPQIQGFLTNKDRFVNRGEALIIAKKSGQTEKCIGELFSEDLW